MTGISIPVSEFIELYFTENGNCWVFYVGSPETASYWHVPNAQA